MTPIVHLHIGEPKTGTTFIQAMLFHNREAMLTDGVLVPGDKLDQIRGGHDVLGRAKTAGTHDTAGAWQDLADQVVAFEGMHAVISMEMLTRARPRQIQRAVDAFGGRADVRVVVTARDVADLAPARWQESVQFRQSWRFEDYLDSVFDVAGRDTPAGRHFWGLHDTPTTVRAWAEAVGQPNVTVVTVPKSRVQPDLLWHRFGTAIGVPVSAYEPVERANASLGRESAELMQRVNVVLEGSDLKDADYARICRQTLGKSILQDRRALENPIVLPAAYRGRAHEISKTLVAGLRDLEVPVIGDLDDLMSAPQPEAVDQPAAGELSSESVVDAAVAAVAGLVAQNAALTRQLRHRGKP